jgi:hypothetical protein
MRRAASVVLAFGLVAAPAAAEEADRPRAERAALLLQIAELTDRMEDSEAAVVATQMRQAAARTALARARDRLRRRAVSAYVYGLRSGVDDAPRAYLEVAIRKDRELIERVKAAADGADDDGRRAEDAREELRRAEAALQSARAVLDHEVAAAEARDEEQRRADEARRQAIAAREAARRRSLSTAASPSPLDPGALLPRHRAATQRQIELMRRYAFGPLSPGAPLPANLRPTGQRFAGLASWYGPGFHGRATASGAIYDQEGWTTASRELPLGTILLVTRNDRRVILLVNDRGPYVEGRVLDLSHAAARHLGVGLTHVDAEILAPV